MSGWLAAGGRGHEVCVRGAAHKRHREAELALLAACSQRVRREEALFTGEAELALLPSRPRVARRGCSLCPRGPPDDERLHPFTATDEQFFIALAARLARARSESTAARPPPPPLRKAVKSSRCSLAVRRSYSTLSCGHTPSAPRMASISLRMERPSIVASPACSVNTPGLPAPRARRERARRARLLLGGLVGTHGLSGGADCAALPGGGAWRRRAIPRLSALGTEVPEPSEPGVSSSYGACASGSTKPVSIAIVVVLPAPFAPSSAVISPPRISRFNPATATPRG